MRRNEDSGGLLPADDAAPAFDGGLPSPRLADLVVFLDGRDGGAAAAEWAASLAQAHGARLTGVFIEPAATVSQPDMFARGDAMREVILAGDDRVRRVTRERRALFESVLHRHSLRGEWRPVHSLLASELVVHARYADLAVVAREDPSDERSAPLALPEALVLGSGRPIVLLPPRCPTSDIHRILAGWNGSAEAARAVAAAMPLLQRAEAVEVVLIDRKGHEPAQGREPGADIAQHLARHGAQVEVRRLQCDAETVGRALLSRAAAFGADLVVMGAYGHSRLRERVFGGVTRTALAEATMPVLMCR